MKKTLLSFIVSALIGSSGFAQNLIVNGGFELPDDGSKHLFIKARTGWFSDDTKENRNGTELSPNMFGNFYWFNINIAGTIYQPIDKVTSSSATYDVSYYYGTVYNADAGNDVLYSVVYFSHYKPGSSIKNRKLIDSIATDVTSLTWNSLVSVSFKLPAKAIYAGDSLVVEFATRVVDNNMVNNNTWAASDSIVVTKKDVAQTVNSVNSATLTFSPNPVTNFIHLKDVESGAIVKFYSLTGQNVLTTTTQNGRIDVSGFNSGIYIIKVDNGINITITKMVKK